MSDKIKTFRNAKVGDRVWSIRFGWGKITEVLPRELYSIVAGFNNTSSSFTFDGKYDSTDINPELFWNEFKIPPEAFVKPQPKLEVDTKVWVWECPDTKYKRHFYEFNPEGLIRTYSRGKSSFTTDMVIETWTNWELYNE